MGLKNIAKTSETATLKLRNPKTGEPLKNSDGTDMTIEVMGPYSKGYKANLHAQAKARLERAQDGGMALTLEQIEADTLGTQVACTVGWNIQIDGDEFAEFSEGAVRALYTEEPWVADQVSAFIEDKRNFLG